MKEKLRSLECLRAAAALLVVLFHTETIFSTPQHTLFGGAFSAGNRGVDLFFVLSGFIIAFVHWDDFDQPRQLGRYLYRRVCRIYPALWVMTCLALLTYMVGFGGDTKSAKLGLSAVLASFLLLAQNGTPLVNVSWTLTYEIFFYAVFALAILNRFVGIAVFVTWQIAILIVATLHVPASLAVYYTRPVCLEFSLGLLCAWVVRRGPIFPGPLSWLVLTLGIIAFILGMTLNAAFDWAGTLCAVCAAAMILALVSLERRAQFAVPEPLVHLGGAAYSIYIVHYSVITLLAAILVRHFHLAASVPLSLSCAAAGVAGGLAFDRLIDRPIQRALRR